MENYQFPSTYTAISGLLDGVDNSKQWNFELWHYCIKATIYPIYAFDVSKQTERLKNSPIDVRISATFKEAVGHSNAIAYALILSDKIINLQSDGNKMIVY